MSDENGWDDLAGVTGQQIIDCLSAIVEHLEAIEEKTISPYQQYAGAAMSALVSRLDVGQVARLLTDERTRHLLAKASWEIAAAMTEQQPHVGSAWTEGGEL